MSRKLGLSVALIRDLCDDGVGVAVFCLCGSSSARRNYRTSRSVLFLILFLTALLLFTSRGAKHSVTGVVCTELAAHWFPVEELSRFWLYFMRIALYFCHMMFSSVLKDNWTSWSCNRDESYQTQVDMLNITSGKFALFILEQWWQQVCPQASRSLLCRLSVLQTTYFLLLELHLNAPPLLRHIASIGPNHTHKEWHNFS